MKIKQGISLIVLVITIIVMVILAGAIVLTLNNNGIIDRASDAVEQTNLATVKELTQMAWAEAYANGARTQEEFQDAVGKALEANKVDLEKYGIVVTTSGVEVANGWIQAGLKVKRGTTVLEIGDTVNYDEEVEAYTAGWKVLGAEYGELLIMSTADIESDCRLTGEGDFLNGITKLNTLCEPYGNGEGAVGARSITIEDVNKVTGYNPKTARYEKGQIGEYGNKVTFWWTGNKDPYYTSTNGTEGNMGEGYHRGRFIYFNGTSFITSTAPEEFDKENDEAVKITTLTLDYYLYYGTTLTANSKDDNIGLTAGSKEYIMLFRNSANTSYSRYWLASPQVRAYYPYCMSFGMRSVAGGFVGGSGFALSSGGDNSSYGVRAVVSLASDIQVDEVSADNWEILK